MNEVSNQRARLGFGKVNLPTQLATFAVFRMKAGSKESAIDTGKRDIGTIHISPVSAHPQVNGYMNRDFVTHPNGTIIMLQASWKHGASSIRDGCILLRLRQDAALLNVVAKLPTGRENLIGDSFSVFEGYADILSPDEAALHKVVIPNNFIDKFFDPDEINECFTIQEVRPARADKPVMSLVSTAQGVVMQEVIAAPARRMRFRKPV